MYTLIIGATLAIVLMFKKRVVGIFLLGFCVFDFLYSLKMYEGLQTTVFYLSIFFLCASMIAFASSKGENKE